MPPRRRAATTAAAADDVPMREADADLGFDDERDGARAGALGLAPRVRWPRGPQILRAAAGGEEEGRSARGGNGCRQCSRPIECLRTRRAGAPAAVCGEWQLTDPHATMRCLCVYRSPSLWPSDVRRDALFHQVACAAEYITDRTSVPSLP